jgi:hypothetical protein
MKATRVKCAVALLAITASMLTGCGGGSSKGGYSSPEKAAEAYFEAWENGDAKNMIKLIPGDVLESMEDMYNVTESQLQKTLQDWMEEKNIKDIYDGYKVKGASSKEEFDVSEMQGVNYCLGSDGYDVEKKSEEGYTVYVTIAYNGSESDSDRYIYEYDGKWYCYDMFDIVDDLLG